MPDSTPQNPERSHITRRTLLIASSVTVLGAMGLLPMSATWAQKPDTESTSPSNGAELSEEQLFHQVACILCDDAALDPRLTASAQRALAVITPQFDELMRQIASWHAKVLACAFPQSSCAEPDVSPELEAFMREIVRALYTGRVGTGMNMELVAYEQALMFAPTRHITVIPSYSLGACNSWVKPPAV